MVLPVSLAMTSSRSARRASRTSPARCRISARSSPDSAPQALPFSTAVSITVLRVASSVMVAASTAAFPRVEVGTRSRMARPQSRLAGRDGSVSGVLSKESCGRGCGGRLRFCCRLAAGTSSSSLSREARKRCFSRSNRDFVFAQLEDGGHEVVLAGALFEAADQVGDGDVELGRVHHRGVEQERADVLLDGFGLALCHAQEHLELDAGLHAALLGEQPGEGDVEEVVAGHADADVPDPVRVQGVVDDALVVGVRILLGVPGGQRPVVEGGLHLLHGQVGALDHADLDGGTAVGAALRGPVLEADHGGEGVRQVGLQHDAGLEVLELGLVQDPGEDRDGHVQVLVFLHVQVDELGLAVLPAREGGGAREQRGELLHDVLHGLVERPGGVRGHGGGDLDGDVVHVRAGQERVGALEPAGGLVLAQDGFAQEVDVELDAVLADLGDGRAQLGVGGVHDQVAHHFAEDPAGDRDDNLRQDRGHGAAELHCAAHVPGQERRHLGGEGGKVAGGDVQVFGADHAVDESDREVQAVRVLQDAGELLGRSIHRNL